MDGYEVSVGDSVFDVARGPGVVEAVGDVDFVVAFGSSGFSTTYRPTGHGGFKWRTLYWADPVPEPPSKDPEIRTLAAHLFQGLYKSLKDFRA